MKRILAFAGAIVFLLVLLVKPFDFIETYSIHAGHMAHEIQSNRHDGHQSTMAQNEESIASDQHVLVELANASTEADSFQTGFWLIGLTLLATFSLALTIKMRRKED